MRDNMETSKKLQHLSKIRKEMDYLQFELKLNSTEFLKIKKSFCDFLWHSYNKMLKAKK